MVSTRCLCAGALLLAAASLLSCSSNHAPDVPDRPAGPDYCFKDSTYAFRTVATDPDGDSVAVRFDWGDSTASHWQGWYASGETVELTHAWSDTGTFNLRASAQDRKLLTSEPSDSLAVRVAIRWPPETPTTPAGPSVGVTDSSYSFVAGANHPDGIDVAIRFAWGDGDTSDWSDFFPSGEPLSAKHAWSLPGTYAVAAQAKDTGDAMSQWSLPHSVAVGRPGSLRMVGDPTIAPDGKRFMVNFTNTGTRDDTVSWLSFLPTSVPLYLKDGFHIGPDHAGFPLSVGKGPGDTIRLTAPAVIAPDGLIEMYCEGFYNTPNPTGSDTTMIVIGNTFEFRFSDGSEITVKP
jgi:hypothetical protein